MTTIRVVYSRALPLLSVFRPKSSPERQAPIPVGISLPCGFKPQWWGYKTENKFWWYLYPFRYNTGVWQTSSQPRCDSNSRAIIRVARSKSARFYIESARTLPEVVRWRKSDVEIADRRISARSLIDRLLLMARWVAWTKWRCKISPCLYRSGEKVRRFVDEVVYAIA